MRIRRITIAGAGALALLIGIVTLPSDPAVYMLPASVGCLAAAVILAGWPKMNRWLAPIAGVVGGASLAVTVLMLTVVNPGRGEPEPPTSLWLLLEPAVTLIFVYLPVRWSPPNAAVLAGGSAALGWAFSVQRYIQGTPLTERVPASAMWMVPAIAVGVIAWYLRSLEAGRERAVHQARHKQRLELAADLHDFVAHDVSEIVAQTQAVNVVLSPSDPRLSEALRRIETAGLRALASMDRTVHVLRDTEGAAVSAAGGMADVDELVARFAAASVAEVKLDKRLTAEVPRETGALAYRLIVEALTNVRRHADSATLIIVRLVQDDGWLMVSVTDDGRAAAAAARAAVGTGLAGLAERVDALGGELTAGAGSPHGWHLEAALPLPQEQ